MNLATKQTLVSRVKQSKLVAIMRGIQTDEVDFLVDALIEGGVRTLEFTFDHNGEGYAERTCEKVARTIGRYGSDLLVGCGTVLTAQEVDLAIAAGAQLIISPNVSEAVIRCTAVHGAVSMPGAFTPTEIVNAYDFGADFVKLFPAGELGVGYIKAVRGPLFHIPMTAVGGIKPENVGVFLDAGVSGFGVGGELILKDAIKAGDYGAIAARARAFTTAIAEWEGAQ